MDRRQFLIAGSATLVALKTDPVDFVEGKKEIRMDGMKGTDCPWHPNGFSLTGECIECRFGVDS